MGSHYFVQWTILGLILQSYSYESMGCSESVKVGLLKLKASMQHLNGSALSSWRDDGGDCCKWERVGCDNSTKRVLHLFLNGIATRPLFIKPEEVGEQQNGSFGVNGWSLNASLFLPFEDLQVLDLSSNFLADLYGVIKLNNLKALHLRQNLLTRAPILSALPSLEILDVSHNILEEFPDSQGLCQLRNIEELDLSDNRITGNLPQCISNLTSLYFLDLSRNNFQGTIPPIFHNLHSLEYISLSNNYFNGSFSFSSLSNNSKLLVFDLVSFNNNLKIETENPPRLPPFQLKIFRLSNCILNEPSGMVPSFLLYQHDLIVVELSHITMRGKVPTWLLVNNTRLEIFNLAGNLLTGPLELNSTSEFLKLTWFDVSDNSINGKLPSDLGFLIPNLVSLNMSRNELQGSVPASLGGMKIIEYLDLSSNNFSGPLPDDLITECISTSLRKLSDNSLSGLLTSESNLTELYYMLLDNNLFHTDISNGLLACSRLSYLDISHNFLSGNIPNWIGNFPRLNVLISSYNFFEGPIPTSLCNLTELNLLDLSHNRFNHTLPPCVSLSHLEYLHLQNNELTGPVPNILSQASALRALDMSDNKLSGEIPSWISSLPNLRFLLLKGNVLEGPIPFQLCQPHNITMLDLSHNRLSGEIPPCLHVARGTNPKGLKSPLFDGVYVLHNYSLSSNPEIHYDPFFECVKVLISFSKTKREEEIEFSTKNRLEHYKGLVLNLMSGMDLSCNDLTGSIPSEIGYLSDVHSLNLSRNNLSGPIPETFSALEQIESLDLSHNRLSGQIPPQLIELTSLSFFSVAHNYLSGMTPKRINQFGTFEPESYEGNPLLCGPPMVKTCSTGEGLLSLKTWFSYSKEDDSLEIFASFAGSFVVSFFSVIGFLYLKSYYKSESYIPFLSLFCKEYGVLS